MKRRASSDSAEVEASDSDEAEQEAYAVSSPYLRNVRFLDQQYGIRLVGSTLMIGDAPITVHAKGDLTIGGTLFKVVRVLWELLTRKNVNSDVITKSDLNAYRRILLRTNAHLAGYEPRGEYRFHAGLNTLK